MYYYYYYYYYLLLFIIVIVIVIVVVVVVVVVVIIIVVIIIVVIIVIVIVIIVIVVLLLLLLLRSHPPSKSKRHLGGSDCLKSFVVLHDQCALHVLAALKVGLSCTSTPDSLPSGSLQVDNTLFNAVPWHQSQAAKRPKLFSRMRSEEQFH